MRKLYLLLPALLVALISIGQTLPVLPIDFESATVNYTFTDFGGGGTTVIANPQSGGINTSATVGKMVKSAPEVYGGSFISLLAPIDFSVNKTFKVKVFMPRVGAKLLLKVENPTNGAVFFEKEATGTVANAWEELSFDYSTISTSNQYQKIVLIFDLGTAGNGSASFTYLFDDITLTPGGGGGGPALPTIPLDFESGTLGYSFTDFDGGGTTKIANPQSGGINTSANVAKMIKSAGQPWGGSWILLGASLDFSVNKIFKVKVFMPRVGAKLLLKVEDQSNGAINFEKEATGTVANAWEELTFDYSTINTANQYQKITFIFDLGTGGDGTANFTYLFDDIILTNTGGGGGGGLTQMTLPVTFDDATVDYGLVGFGGAEASSIVVDPTLTSNKVAKVIKSATAELWAGTTITGASGGLQMGFSTKIPFTAAETKMSARVWSPDAGIKVRMKVEDRNDPTKSVETEVTTTLANTWETLEFNFANQASGTAALNLGYNYDKASIFFNFGVTGAVSGEKTYYFDDVQFGGGTPPPASSPVLPLTFESGTYSFTDFDGGGTTTIANPQTAGNNSTTVSRMIKSPGQVWGGSWISLAAPIDFSANKFFRVKVFMPRVGAKLLLKVENQTDGGIAFEKEATGTVANAWEELFFDYSTINTANQYQKIVLIFDLGTAGDGTANFTYLFDDINLTSGALAVKLTSFDARLVNNKAMVKWISESEINHDHYEIERSIDGIHFASRGRVNGNGNSSITQTYEFADDLNAVPAIVYYRLKIVDNSGKYSYSKIVAVNTGGLLSNGKFNSYPNPFISGIKVSLSSKADALAGIRIISLDGKELMNNRMMVQKGENILVLKDLEKLPKGNYILEVTTPANKHIKKIMKN